ncbi:hypothetical protein G6F57_001587 [Rhizopus arrhizus]|uniref:Ubiquitin-like domain-containing protein n=1 Tax=Rhizopus oryzae TaxID=64495 RepID=A0A9P6XDY0_RHIOR|nr:hypothetical protein G6F23_002162 [Rhizopus arrhizus]KAG1422041.1 hypothetical protein G6F58_003470 [Rhizopus delemar]KAG0766657.1 hypothetical protein G6F24_003428 [Rhizopus arrhizus]KAG0793367.1 hypothetical protein G6F21_003664 [Rhizopus arrhizus]KAG0801329.1 hypothetical protein G6F22_001355 [Rhizopus arrhizus]
MNGNMNDTQPSNVNIEKIALQIKSLEQRTTSITLPRNASVLQLKQEIQIAFDIESNRQRLIFQGRVLKDDKNLTDYANLDNGKVVHLVIRPADAPQNPANDDPTPGTTNARNARSGARIFPSISSRFPMMEGYAFITLDSTIGELGDNNSLISSVLNGLTSGGRPRSSTPPTTDSPLSNLASQTNRSASPATPSLFRSPFSFSFGHRGSSGEQRSPLASSALGFPPNVEVRLARTLASMRNVRTMLNESSTNEDIPSTLGVNSTAEQLQEIRNRLRNSDSSQLSQVGMALDELADLADETIPRLRGVAQSLREEPTEDDLDINRRVLFMSRIVQGMSLINHFMGSVLATIDIDSRRPRSQSNVRQSTRGDTQALRASAPTVVQASSTSNLEISSASTSTGLKRKCNEDNTNDSVKKAKQEKGKGKDKTD